MQRWWPSGQTGGPCWEQGRQAQRLDLDHACPARPRGPKPNAGTVGPKIATIGVPDAAARCSGAESLVTRTRAPRISAADWRRSRAAGGVARPGRARRSRSAARQRGRPGPPTRTSRRQRQPRASSGIRASAWCPRCEPGASATNGSAMPRFGEQRSDRGAVLRPRGRSSAWRAASGAAAVGQRQQPVDSCDSPRGRDRAGVEASPRGCRRTPMRSGMRAANASSGGAQERWGR